MLTPNDRRGAPSRFCTHCGIRVGGNEEFCPTCGARMRFGATGQPEIIVEGKNADEVERVAHSLFTHAPGTRPVKKFPLVGGAFFLIAFIVIFGGILTAARLLSVYVFVLVLVGGVIIFSVVGAFILRQDENLSEKGFIELMKLSFRYLPLLRKR